MSAEIEIFGAEKMRAMKTKPCSVAAHNSDN
jgi:hypothetical protein